MLFYGIAGFFNLLLNYAVIMKIYSFPMRGAQVDFLLLSACFVFCLLGFGALLGLLCKNSLHAMQWLMALTYPFFVLAGFSWAAYGNAGFSGTDCKLSARHPLPRPRPQYHSDGASALSAPPYSTIALCS